MPEMTAPFCPECGAPLPQGSTCRDLFHALLLLEGAVPDAPGGLPHFYAVACYALQHPDSMGYTAEALHSLRTNLGEVLDGLPLDALRRRTRRAVNGPARVLRHAGAEPFAWKRGTWPMTIADVCTVMPKDYVDRVSEWAQSVRATLDQQGGT